MPSGLEELELVAPPQQEVKTPPASCLTDPQVARDLYTKRIYEDQVSSTKRARVQAMKDGEPPFNQSRLNASGQGSRSNANFLMGQDLISKANNGYNDMVTSTRTLMTIEVEGGEPAERTSYSQIIAQELSRTIRKWSGFFPNFQRLVDIFVTHGVAIEYPLDDEDFRFSACGMGDFLIPREVEASEEKIPYAIARKDLAPVDLWAYVRNEEAAKARGWDVDAVKIAIGNATTAASYGQLGEIETMQRQIKNNDIGSFRKFSHIPLLYCWVREYDGTISFYITEKDNPQGKFLFKKQSRFTNCAEAYNFFCYGVGNGTFHGIRGMGEMIFALVQLHNRLMSQTADSVMMEGAIIMQAESANAMQQAELHFYGPFAMMSPGFEVVQRHMSGTSNASLPFLGEVKSLMGQTSSRFMAQQTPGQAYQNKDKIGAELEEAASMDSGAPELFYASWDRTMRRMCRRIIEGKSSTDPLVAEFHRRVKKAGITPEILSSVDHDSTYAYRAIGSGSPAARAIGFKKLLELLPQLDEIGRKNLIYQFVADIVGYQNASEYASPAAVPRLGPEATDAVMENQILFMGNAIPVLPDQMHATHAAIHLPKILEVLEGIELGDIDPMEELPSLQAALDHLAEHGEALAQDPTQAAIYGQVREAVNNTQQVVDNMIRKLKSEERKAKEAGEEATATGQPGPDPKELLEWKKLQLADLKFDLAKQKGELEISMQQAKAAQNLAINDLKAKEQLLLKARFPRSDAQSRR